MCDVGHAVGMHSFILTQQLGRGQIMDTAAAKIIALVA